VDSTATAVGQLSKAIDQITRGSQEQAGQVEQASNIVSQVSKAVGEVAQNAQATATGSQEANEAARAGAEMVSRRNAKD
jgi:methyl-accepting chemotaxis protein